MVRRKNLISLVARGVAKLGVIIAVGVSLASQSFAQSSQNASGEQRTNAFGGPRKQLATIIFAGLGGAVLGLSTLSFYGRPQDNLRNIAFGAGAGIILGTVVVTYKAATNPSELYGSSREPRPFIEKEIEARQSPPAPRGPLAFQFEF